MPGIPVVIASNGLGTPVRQVESGAPVMTVAANGLGTPIVLSDRGTPFVVEGDAAFNPISLFANGEDGGFYLPADLTMISQQRFIWTPAVLSGFVGVLLDQRKFGGQSPTEFLVGKPDLLNGAGSFDSATGWTVGTGWTIAGGMATKTAGSTGNLERAVDLSSRYVYITGTISGRTTGAVIPTLVGGGLTQASGLNFNGNFAVLMKRDVATSFRMAADSLFDGSIDNLVIKELTGNHLVAASDAVRPDVVEDVNSRRYIDFNGSEALRAVFSIALGSNCTVAVRTSSGVTYLTAQTIAAGAYALPTSDWYWALIINRDLTTQEVASLDAYFPFRVTHPEEFVSFANTTPVTANAVQVTPPDLYRPTTTNITDANFNITLGAGDHIIVFPNTGLTKPVQINGNNVANHIFIRGGEISLPLNFDKDTMRLADNSDYAVFTQVGFTGATGGTFRVKCSEATGIFGLDPVETAEIPYNATAAQIKTAINTAIDAFYTARMGSPQVVNGCFDVVGTGTGGPWKFVPSANAAMGRVDLILTNLTGSPVKTARTNIYNAALQGLVVKNWKGTFHGEGIYINGTNTNDGINFENANAGSRSQIVNVHSEGLSHFFHNDWIHPDGVQSYRGPSKLYIENSDFISNGGNGLIGQPNTIAWLITLFDWWYKKVFFMSYKSDDDPYRLDDGGTALYYTLTASAWMQWMLNCFAQRGSWATKTDTPTGPDSDFNSGGKINPPTGLTIRSRPPSGIFCDPAQNQCGLNYVPPGYLVNNQPPETTLRFLDGEPV